jgi:hypothetical protein
MQLVPVLDEDRTEPTGSASGNLMQSAEPPPLETGDAEPESEPERLESRSLVFQLREPLA